MLITYSITIIIVSIFISVTNNQENDCQQSLDIFFMIDGSASLGEDNFNSEKELVAQISNKLNTNDNGNTEIINRYGYIIISNSIDEILDLTEYTDFILFLDNVAYPRISGTNVSASLQYVNDNVFNINTIRPNTQRILVLLSDGEFSESGIETAFKNIEENADVRIIVFGFTDGVDEVQLQSIATEPINENYFKFDNFSEALNSVERLGSTICPVPAPAYEVNTNIESGSVVLEFEFSSNVDNFNICFKKVGTSTCIGQQSFGDQVSGDTLTATYTGLTATTAYEYDVTFEGGSTTGTVTTASGTIYITNVKDDCDYDTAPNHYPNRNQLQSIGCNFYVLQDNYAVIETKWGVTGISEDDVEESWTLDGTKISFSDQIESIQVDDSFYDAYVSTSNPGVYLYMEDLGSKLIIKAKCTEQTGEYTAMFISNGLMASASSYVSEGSIIINSDEASNCPAVFPAGAQTKKVGETVCSLVNENAKIEADFTVVCLPEEGIVDWYYGDELIQFGGIKPVAINGEILVLRCSTNPMFVGYEICATNALKELYLPNIQPIHAGNYTLVVSVGLGENKTRMAQATSEVFVKEPEICQNQIALHFMIDASGSLQQSGFDQEKLFIINLIKRFMDGERLFSFQLFSQIAYSFSNFTDKANFISKLNSAPYMGEGTNLQIPLEFTLREVCDFWTQIPKDVSKVAVMLTDGKHTSGDGSMISDLSSNIFRECGAEIVAIGFGAADLEELRTIATPNEPLIFSNLSAAEILIDQISDNICEVMPTCCQGTKGLRGERGPTGDTGEQGPRGKAGWCVTLENCINAGSLIKCMTGPQGERGSPGDQGEAGLTGPKGAEGSSGLQGVKGAKGSKGPLGPEGIKGAEGEKGVQGAKGDKGNRGSQGLKGQPGIKGQLGLDGSIGECKGEISCTGEKGLKGDVGERGQRGIKGGDGAKGARRLTGDKGNAGNDGIKGNTGVGGVQGSKGTAIEFSTVTSEQNCANAGELKYDNVQNKLHFCNGSHYRCIGNNGMPCEKVCECITSMETPLMCGANTTLSVDIGRDVCIDFVLVMDDSSSMKDQQAWILQHIPTLNNSLVSNGIGSSMDYPNSFQLLAFGGNPNAESGQDFEAPHFVTPTNINYDPATEPFMDVTFYTEEELNAAIMNLENFRVSRSDGRIERGYETLDYALNNMQIRPSNENASCITLLIFVTNEDSDDYSEQNFLALVNRFRNIDNLIPTFIPLVREIETVGDTNVNFAVANNPNTDMLIVIDRNSQNTSRNYGTVRIDPGDNQNIINVKRDYVDLLMCSEKESSSIWDLSFVDTNAEAFATGFLSLSNMAIVSMRDLLRCTYCYCGNAADNGCIDIQKATEYCSCLRTAANERTQACSCIAGEIDTLTRGGTTVLNEANVAAINNLCVPRNSSLGDCRSYTIS